MAYTKPRTSFAHLGIPCGTAAFTNLTHPLNPPPQAGDFGRYAPKVAEPKAIEIITKRQKPILNFEFPLSSPALSVERAVGYRLRDMARRYIPLTRQIGNRACHLDYAVVGACR